MKKPEGDKREEDDDILDFARARQLEACGRPQPDRAWVWITLFLILGLIAILAFVSLLPDH